MASYGSGPSKTAERTFRVLEVIAHRQRPISATRISSLLDEDRSAIYRSLKTLVSLGLITQDPDNRLFQISLRILSLTKQLTLNWHKAEIINEALEKISEHTGESCTFEILEHDHVVVVERVQGTIADKFKFDIGAATPAPCTSIGKTIMAFRPKMEAINMIKGGLEQHTENTITSREGFLKALEKAHDDGYAIDDREYDLELRCAAAPILEKNMSSESGLAICGEAKRLSKNDIIDLAKMLKEETGTLSKAIYAYH